VPLNTSTGTNNNTTTTTQKISIMYIKEKRTFKLTMLTPHPKFSTNRKKNPKKKIFYILLFLNQMSTHHQSNIIRCFLMGDVLVQKRGFPFAEIQQKTNDKQNTDDECQV
jgi:hypothetical protein